MDQTTLTVLFVVGGVSLITVMTVVMGWGKDVPLAGEDEAIDRLAHDAPAFLAKEVLLADDRKVALLTGVGGRVFAVSVLGDKRWSRQLDASRIRDVQRREGGFDLELRDPGAPVIRCKLKDPTAQVQWLNALGVDHELT